MNPPRSWTMSAIVIGTYFCAVYGARGTAVSAKVLLPRPAVRVPATRPVRVGETTIASIDTTAR